MTPLIADGQEEQTDTKKPREERLTMQQETKMEASEPTGAGPDFRGSAFPRPSRTPRRQTASSAREGWARLGRTRPSRPDGTGHDLGRARSLVGRGRRAQRPAEVAQRGGLVQR